MTKFDKTLLKAIRGLSEKLAGVEPCTKVDASLQERLANEVRSARQALDAMAESLGCALESMEQKKTAAKRKKASFDSSEVESLVGELQKLLAEAREGAAPESLNHRLDPMIKSRSLPSLKEASRVITSAKNSPKSKIAALGAIKANLMRAYEDGLTRRGER